MKKKKNQKSPKKTVLHDAVLRGITGGCGGMTQIDPPTMQLEAGPTDND